MLNLMTTIEKAIEIVFPLADKYKPKYELYYFVETNENNYLNSFEPEQDLNICEDCMAKVEARVQEKYRRKDIELIVESSPENENFTFCDECGEHIETGYIFTEQEFEHWFRLEDEVFKKALTMEIECWELKQILEDCDNTELREKLAERVVKLANE